MPDSLANRLKPEQDQENIFAVIDCPECGEENIPVSYTTFLIPTLYTLCCNSFVENISPKGYVSLLDLEETEWCDNL